ncbi:hypothetical protein, partial [Anaplasma bovis]|uniref:hypothetical protein n=1 Tax=Anaplasma bovis TaxID=186733 RepID=UPI002FF11648
ALDDFEAQLNTLELPFSAEDAIKLVYRYKDTPDMMQNVLSNTSEDAVAVVEQFIADLGVQGISRVENVPLETGIPTARDKALDDFEAQLNTLELPFSAKDAMRLVMRYKDTPYMMQNVLSNTSGDAVALVEQFIADLGVQGIPGAENAPLETGVPTAQDKVKKGAMRFLKKTAAEKKQEAPRSAPVSYGLEFLIDNQLDERNVILALENNGTREVIEYIFSNATDSAVLEKACKKISQFGENGGSSIMSKAIDSIRDVSKIEDFLEVIFSVKDARAKAVLSAGLSIHVADSALACKYEQVKAIIEYEPSCIYGNSLNIMELAYTQGIVRYGQILKDLHKQIIVGTRNGDPRYKKCYPILSIIYISQISPQEACEMLRGLLQSGYIPSKSDVRIIESVPGDTGDALRDIVSSHDAEQEVMGDVLFSGEEVSRTLNSNEEVIEYVLRNASDNAAIEEACATMCDSRYNAAFIISRVIDSMRDQVQMENFLNLSLNQPAASIMRVGLGSKLHTQMLHWAKQGSYSKIESVLRYIPSAIYAGLDGAKRLDLTQIALEQNRQGCANMLTEFHKEILHGLMLGDAKYIECSSLMSIISISRVSVEEACKLLIEWNQSSGAKSEPYKKWILDNAPPRARPALYNALYAHTEVGIAHGAVAAEQPNEENKASLVPTEAQDPDTSKPNEPWRLTSYVGKVQSSISNSIPNVSDTISQALSTGNILYNVGAFMGRRLASKAINAITHHPTVVSTYDNTKAMMGAILSPFNNNDLESRFIAQVKGTRETLGRDLSAKEALNLLTQFGRDVTANTVLGVLLNTSTEAAKEVARRIFDQGKDGIIATVAIANTKDPDGVKNLLCVVFDIVDSDLAKRQISQVLSKHLFDSVRKGGYLKIESILKYDPSYLYETEGGKDLMETALDSGRRRDANMLKEFHKEIVNDYIEGRNEYEGCSALASIAYVSKVSAAEACEMLDALMESGYEMTANLKKWLRENFPRDAHAALDAVFEKRANGAEDKFKVGRTIPSDARSTQDSDISDDESAASTVSTRIVDSADETQDEKSSQRVGSMVKSVTAMRVSARNGADKVR